MRFTFKISIFAILFTFISSCGDDEKADPQLSITQSTTDATDATNTNNPDGESSLKDGNQFTCDNCDDGNPCTEEDCDPFTGICQFTPIKGCCLNDSGCDDEDTCSEDHCDEDKHMCYHLNVENTCCNSSCDDGDLCTIDECVGEEGCVYTPTCDDGIPCTDDSCDSITGVCSNIPLDELCDDGHSATVEQCNIQTGTCDYAIAPGMCVIQSNGWARDEVSPIDRCQSCQPDLSQIVFSSIDCDDGDPCTNDGCDSTPCYMSDDPSCDENKPGCTHELIKGCCLSDSDCDDDNVCNGEETCDDNNICVAGTPNDCDDGNTCNGTETCDTVTGCQPGTSIEGCCTSDEDCNNQCWTSSCVAGTCSTPKPVVCDDGDTCNGLETCNPETGCTSGTPLDCNDEDPCTDDSCDSETGVCVHKSIENCCTSNNECTDENACNGTETCTDNTCILDTSPDCSDGNPCTDDSCDSETGECVHDLVTECCMSDDDCTEGDACKGIWTCVGGQCKQGDKLDCTDDDACTLDTCTDGACQFLVLVCDDHDACTSNTCDPDAGCVYTSEGSCNDDNTCTDDSCDAETGACMHEPIEDCCTSDDECIDNVCNGQETCVDNTCIAGEPLVCDDNNTCTTDICESATGCIFTPHTDPCDDNNACTNDDVCNEGACSGTAIDCDDDNPCTDDSCDSETGACVHESITDCCATDADCAIEDGNVCTIEACIDNVCITQAVEDGTDCNDNNNCTQNDACLDGTCSGEEVTCDDDNSCTTDVCESATGCIFTPHTDPCDDNNACTLDVCFNGSCQQLPIDGCCTTDADCDDSVLCTIDACEGNLCGHTGDNTLCSDNDICNGAETCDVTTGCQSGDTLVCDDGNTCTDDSCDPNTGCTYINNTVPCEDGNPCTINDICLGGTCTPGESPCTDNGNMCNVVSCEPAPFGHNCTTTHIDAPCNDGDPCTKDVCKAPTESCMHYPVIPCTP